MAAKLHAQTVTLSRIEGNGPHHSKPTFEEKSRSMSALAIMRKLIDSECLAIAQVHISKTLAPFAFAIRRVYRLATLR